MVKGTSRQVIVVHAPEEKLFDQAIFILREGAVGEGGVSDEALLREAKGYLGVSQRQEYLCPEEYLPLLLPVRAVRV